MNTHIENKELNRIAKRAIEALAVAPVIRAVFQRTKTIMEGADHCDFRYYLNSKGGYDE